jgi:hypothetical protein
MIVSVARVVVASRARRIPGGLASVKKKALQINNLELV